MVLRLATIVMVMLGTLIAQIGYSRWFRDLERLRIERSRVEQLYANSPDAQLSLSSDFEVQFANPIAVALAGMPFESVVGEACYKALWGRDELCDDCPACSVLSDGRRRERVVLDDSTGTDRWFDHSVYPVVGTDGSIESLVEVYRDITSLQGRRRGAAPGQLRPRGACPRTHETARRDERGPRGRGRRARADCRRRWWTPRSATACWSTVRRTWCLFTATASSSTSTHRAPTSRACGSCRGHRSAGARTVARASPEFDSRRISTPRSPPASSTAHAGHPVSPRRWLRGCRARPSLLLDSARAPRCNAWCAT